MMLRSEGPEERRSRRPAKSHRNRDFRLRVRAGRRLSGLTTAQHQFLHVLMRFGCFRTTAARICAHGIPSRCAFFVRQAYILCDQRFSRRISLNDGISRCFTPGRSGAAGTGTRHFDAVEETPSRKHYPPCPRTSSAVKVAYRPGRPCLQARTSPGISGFPL